jgi:Fe2+ or Zn2+ uptake regulation protein
MGKLTRETHQKEIIRKELENMKNLFTGEELFIRVRAKNIGKATVYRFLKDLRNNGQIHTYLCDRRMTYSKEKRSHCHFTCEKCGKMQHFEIKEVDFINKNLNGKMCHFQLDVTGICNNCE